MFCFRWPQTIVILLPHTVYSIALNFCLHFTISSLKKTKKTNRISSFVYIFFLRCWSKWSHTCIPTVPFFYDLCEQHAVVPCDDIHVTTTSAAERMILRPTDLCILFVFLWNTKYSTSSWEWPRELTMTHTNCLSAAGVTHVNIWQRSRENQHTHNNKKWLWKKKL